MTCSKTLGLGVDQRGLETQRDHRIPCPHRSPPSPTLSLSYLGDIVRCYGKEIDLVSQPLGGLHRGNIGVDQQRLDVFLLQGLDRLETKMAYQPGLEKQDCK